MSAAPDIHEDELHGKDCIAVIFTAWRTDADPAGYHDAANAMEKLAAVQPGYKGMDSVRGEDGKGITVSYWQDDVSAKAWRDQPEHAAIRARGRGIWYSRYTLHVARIERGYAWP